MQTPKKIWLKPSIEVVKLQTAQGTRLGFIPDGFLRIPRSS